MTDGKQQTTHGDQAPAVDSGGGDVHISYHQGGPSPEHRTTSSAALKVAAIGAAATILAAAVALAPWLLGNDPAETLPASQAEGSAPGESGAGDGEARKQIRKDPLPAVEKVEEAVPVQQQSAGDQSPNIVGGGDVTVEFGADDED